MEALDITTTRALEDLCINTIYASLLTGKLSPQTQTFQITSCTSRDLSPTTHAYTDMIATLLQWSRQCDLVLAEITGRIRDIKLAAMNRKLAEEDYEREVENAKNGVVEKKPVKQKSGGKLIGTGDEDESMQDIQEQEEAGPSVLTGGESPTGRKRKLVRLQTK
jgi:COP9 signalosome complex subunit 7